MPTLLQYVTQRTQRSNSDRRFAIHCLEGTGGFGGDNDRCTEIAATISNDILRYSDLEGGLHAEDACTVFEG